MGLWLFFLPLLLLLSSNHGVDGMGWAGGKPGGFVFARVGWWLAFTWHISFFDRSID